MHATLHAFIASGALCVDEQPTNTSFFLGASDMRCFGHAFAHWPQATHLSSSITATPSLICIASNSHAFTQSASPRHPNSHTLLPPYSWLAALHDFISASYSEKIFAWVWLPLQVTLNILGSVLPASTPMIAASFSATALPPTGQSVHSLPSATASA